MKKATLALALLLTVVISGCIASERRIGGDTDEHGCLIAAGYSWCESKEKCLRTWEEPCPGMVRSFSECEALGYPIMESYPRQCRTPDGETFVEDIGGYTDETKAEDIAKNYARNMEEYKNENGRDLEVINVMQARCPGCWQVVVQYDLDLGKDTEGYLNDRMSVNMTLDNWEVTRIAAARGAIMQEEYCIKEDSGEKMSLKEAKEIAKGSACDEGALTGSYVCNEYTGTWWMDIDIEKAGCNPACVIDVATKEAEINWRCTGLLN